MDNREIYGPLNSHTGSHVGDAVAQLWFHVEYETGGWFGVLSFPPEPVAMLQQATQKHVVTRGYAFVQVTVEDRQSASLALQRLDMAESGTGTTTWITLCGEPETVNYFLSQLNAHRRLGVSKNGVILVVPRSVNVSESAPDLYHQRNFAVYETTTD